MLSLLSALPEWQRTGGLGWTSKMPAWSYGLPATTCPVGRRLAVDPTSVCAACYALRGRYRFPAVQAAQARRLQAVLTSPTWVPDMARLLTAAYALVPPPDQFFRWHDSGDLLSLAHFEALVAICRATPWLCHWLPTRETGVLQAFLASGQTWSANLVIRVSASHPDRPAPSGPWTTGTVTAHAPPLGLSCPAWDARPVRCGSCRACWSTNVPVVSYPLH